MSDHTIHRRWLSCVRVRVWGLMVFVLSVAIGLSWIVRSSRVQRDAAAAIEKTGGGSFTIGNGRTAVQSQMESRGRRNG